MDTLAESRSEPSRHARERLVELLREEGLTVAAVVSVLDRLAGGGETIQTALGDDAEYVALSTINEVYPERPDRD